MNVEYNEQDQIVAFQLKTDLTTWLVGRRVGDYVYEHDDNEIITFVHEVNDLEWIR